MSTNPFKSILRLVGSNGKDADAAYRSRSSETSALVSYYSTGHDILNTGSGTSDGMRYGMYMTTPAGGDSGESFIMQSTVIYVLNLPFNTQVHLLGVNTSSTLSKLQFETYLTAVGMAKVALDEEFDKVCDMYTGRDHEFRVQYALDPDAMAFVKKYCRTHLWELHDSELYVVVPDNAIGSGQFVIESHSFVDAIRAALPAGNPTATITHREIAFTIYDGPNLRCPICQKHMTLQEDAWFRCKNGHGMLVTDRQLDQLVNNRLHEHIDSNAIIHHGPLTCPHCHHPMETMRYNGSKLEVNACSNCQFKWVDTDEQTNLSSLSVGRDFSGD
jgi:hypothetical protein